MNPTELFDWNQLLSFPDDQPTDTQEQHTTNPLLATPESHDKNLDLLSMPLPSSIEPDPMQLDISSDLDLLGFDVDTNTFDHLPVNTPYNLNGDDILDPETWMPEVQNQQTDTPVLLPNNSNTIEHQMPIGLQHTEYVHEPLDMPALETVDSASFSGLLSPDWLDSFAKPPATDRPGLYADLSTLDLPNSSPSPQQALNNNPAQPLVVQGTLTSIEDTTPPVFSCMPSQQPPPDAFQTPYIGSSVLGAPISNPYRPRRLLPKQPTTSKDRSPSQISPLTQLALQPTSVNSQCEKRVAMGGMPSVSAELSRVGQAKRKANSDNGLKFGPLPKKERKSIDSKMAPYCTSFRLQDNPTKKKISRKNARRPCLRCYVQKKACTGGYPCAGCQPYMRGAIANHSSQTLATSLRCIESDLCDLNIFFDVINRRLPAHLHLDNSSWRSMSRMFMKLLDSSISHSEWDVLSNDVKYEEGPALLRELLMRLNAIENLGWPLLLQSPTFKMVFAPICKSPVERYEALSSGTEKTTLKLPSGSKSKIVYSKPMKFLFRPLVWSATLAHRDAICHIFGLDSDSYTFCLIILTVGFLDSVQTQLKGLQRPGMRPENWDGIIIAACTIGTIALHGLHLLSTKENVGNIAAHLDLSLNADKWTHLTKFCEYYYDKLETKLCPHSILFRDIYMHICGELLSLDLEKLAAE